MLLFAKKNIRISYTFHRFSLLLAIFLLIQLLPYLCDKNFVCFTAKRNKVGVISTFFILFAIIFLGLGLAECNSVLEKNKCMCVYRYMKIVLMIILIIDMDTLQISLVLCQVHFSSYSPNLSVE